MNEVGYDIAIPGNHEFDYGMDQFMSFTKNLTCGYLSCNFRNIQTGKLVLSPYQVLSYGDVKVGYVGITTPESVTTSTPKYFMDDKGEFIYGFDGDSSGEKLIQSVQNAVDEVRSKEGVDFVIAVGHLGGKITTNPQWGSSFIVQNTKGIDAFIDGHTHEEVPSLVVKNLEGKDVPITQSGTKLKFVGKVTIDTKGNIKTELVGEDEIKQRDLEIDELISTTMANYEELIKEVIGHTDFELIAMNDDSSWAVRVNETNLANLVTDSFLEEGKNFGGVDISLCNGGGIRANIAPVISLIHDSLVNGNTFIASP